MVKVWWKFKQNQAKATWVTEQNLKNDIFQCQNLNKIKQKLQEL